MKNLNFRSLENLTVPDELMDKLLAIPETSENKPSTVPFWRSRAVIAAASLVLISVLSLIVYFFAGIKSNIQITAKPSSPATRTVWSTDANGETVATEYAVVSDRSGQPTEAESAAGQIPGTGGHSPAAPLGTDQSGRTAHATESIPVDGDRSDPTSAPQGVVTPTQGKEPTMPNVPSTDAPDEPVEPTEPPDLPDPTEAPDEPTEPPDAPDDPTEPPYTDTVSEIVYIGEMQDGNVIYCWLYYNNWRMYNDDAYTAMFYADITPLGDGYALMTYTPKAHGVVLPEAGSYRYLWYLSKDGSHTGRRLTQGYVYLNN